MRRRIVKDVAKFLVVMFVMTIVNTIVWQMFATDLYDCTDDNLLGYLWPGWVHSSVRVVRQVAHDRSMIEPDEIKEGWSVAGLWCLWLFFFAFSIGISLLLARLPWPAVDPPREGELVRADASKMWHLLAFR